MKHILIDRWAGKGTFRVHLFGLWFGYNKHTKHGFVILRIFGRHIQYMPWQNPKRVVCVQPGTKE